MARLIHKAFKSQMKYCCPVMPCEGEWVWSHDVAITTKRYADGNVENDIMSKCGEGTKNCDGRDPPRAPKSPKQLK
eukprot:5575711-Amphidinium_carterae.1